jgi:hypothetical protein
MAAVRINAGWWRLAGAPLLLLISIYGLYGHVMERQHRHDVLARGEEAKARVVRSSGVESVVVAWTDASGRERSAETWVGKPFARQGIGDTVTIKYLPGADIEPVILSEAAERERVNEWWIWTNLGVAVAMAVLCTVIGIFVGMGARSRRAPS